MPNLPQLALTADFQDTGRETRSAPNVRFGAGWGRKDAKRGGGKQVMISESMYAECLIPSSLSPDEHAEPHEVHAVSSAHVPLNASLSQALASSHMANAPAGKAPQLELSLERCNIPEKPHGF